MVRLSEKDKVRRATDYIRGVDQRQVEIGLILGSGFSDLAGMLSEPSRIAYSSIPDWLRASVAGHAGELIIGTLHDKTIAILSGRTHFYENQDLHAVTRPVRVLHQLGCQTLIVTNAAGGLNLQFQVGDLMIIEDQINLPALAGHNPLLGITDPQFGPSFVNMSQAYDPQLRQLAFAAAKKLGLSLQHGVYVMISGPSYETPAEVRFLRNTGADAVGMSTAPEVIVARQCGLRVLGISCIANITQDIEQLHLDHQEVLEAVQKASGNMSRLIDTVIKDLP